MKLWETIWKTMVKTYQMMQAAPGDEIISNARVSEWFHHFKECQTFVKSDENHKYPPTCTKDESVAHVHDLVWTERNLSICEKDEEHGISYESFETTWIKYLGLRHVSAQTADTEV
jgi:hypothetical protein